MNKIAGIVFGLLIACMAVMLFGCSTMNGVSRDIRSASEVGIKLTQKSTDKQQENSIAFALQEQNRIMSGGQEMYIRLADIEAAKLRYSKD